MHGVLCMLHVSVILLCHVRVADMFGKALNWMHAHFNKRYTVFPCSLSQF